MFPNVNPTKTTAWKKLNDHAKEMKHMPIKDLFLEDPDRFKKYCFSTTDIIFDFSKNIVNDETVKLLMELGEECGEIHPGGGRDHDPHEQSETGRPGTAGAGYRLRHSAGSTHEDFRRV